ncbi:helix-turn-helix transcriptional regulator [Elizabethkingia meningoseptica]|uniref:helix-turn-helix domain-containing protein n=1 Tax=Elizabethkingia meningoseptica TaxID=238 RepID=UPI0031594B63
MSLNVERVLKSKGLNKAKLAELLGRGDNRSYVTNLLKSPSLATLEKIAEVLNVDIVELFDPLDSGDPIYKKDENGNEIIIGYLKK